MSIARRLTLLTLAFVTAFTLLPAQGVFAVANPNVGQALEIAPPVLNLSADPGQTVTANIKLRDVSTSPLIVRNEINDFVAHGEDGTPKLLVGEEAGDSPYSLKEWIQPLPEFTLKAKAINDLPIKIRVPANAAPGGYYAIIRFTATPPGIGGSGVSLSASLGALVLLRVKGDAKEAMTIQEFTASKAGSPNWLFESPPIDFVVRMKNSGSVHEQPTGQVKVSDMFGNSVGAVNMNLEGSNVLPASTRRFSNPIDSSVLGDRILFGRYTADVTMNYGSDNQTLKASTSFWVIPYRLIGFAILLLIIAFILIRIGLRRYSERVLSRSRSRRRRR